MGWRWVHCMASCEITHQCGGKPVAWSAGLVKEGLDVVRCVRDAYMDGIGVSDMCCQRVAGQPILRTTKQVARCPLKRPVRPASARTCSMQRTESRTTGHSMGFLPVRVALDRGCRRTVFFLPVEGGMQRLFGRRGASRDSTPAHEERQMKSEKPSKAASPTRISDKGKA